MTMKKKILSAAVLAALGAGTAQAVNLGTDGTGQVMLFPYYTVQGGEETVLSVINTTDKGKAVKIRFREAYNSREVLDFNIYMSPYDVWTAKVQDSAGGGAEIISNDLTCTVPLSISEGKAEPFRPYGYNGQAADTFKDTGPQDITRTNEGYVEIIEMGVMDYPVSKGDPVWDNDDDGRADFKHYNGVPNNCAGIANNFGSDWPASGLGTAGLDAPEGGMFGSLAVINVQSGTEISVNATGLEDVFKTVQHYSTGTLNPTLGDAVPVSNIYMNPEGDQSPVEYTDSWGLGNGIDAVSAVLMADKVMNEYTVNPNVEAESAWVVTFPTKWAYADRVAQADDLGRPIWPYNPAPFTTFFDAPPAGSACEEVGIIAYDREETAQEGDDLDFSPSPDVPGINLCYEVNVIQFAGSNVMSAVNTAMDYANLPGKNGWASIDMALKDGEDSIHAMSGRTYDYWGLPVLGFSASQLGNSLVGDGAAYGTSNSHAYHRTISGSAD